MSGCLAVPPGGRRVHPVVLIDAIHVKIRDGQVTNRPIHVAVGIDTHGELSVLGL